MKKSLSFHEISSELNKRATQLYELEIEVHEKLSSEHSSKETNKQSRRLEAFDLEQNNFRIRYLKSLLSSGRRLKLQERMHIDDQFRYIGDMIADTQTMIKKDGDKKNISMWLMRFIK